MKLFGYLIIHLVANVFALLAAGYLITGFSLGGDFKDWLIAALVLTALNTFIRPFVKLLLSPFILITLGLLSIAINAAILYILDILQEPLTIGGYIPLLLGTLLISATNITIAIGARLS